VAAVRGMKSDYLLREFCRILPYSAYRGISVGALYAGHYIC